MKNIRYDKVGQIQLTAKCCTIDVGIKVIVINKYIPYIIQQDMIFGKIWSNLNYRM